MEKYMNEMKFKNQKEHILDKKKFNVQQEIMFCGKINV